MEHLQGNLVQTKSEKKNQFIYTFMLPKLYIYIHNVCTSTMYLCKVPSIYTNSFR